MTGFSNEHSTLTSRDPIVLDASSKEDGMKLQSKTHGWQQNENKSELLELGIKNRPLRYVSRLLCHYS